MAGIGLRELRQDASRLLRRVESGEEIIITVAGRPSARLVPAGAGCWRRWEDVAKLVAGAPDVDWGEDRELVDQSLRDPWGDQ